MESLVALFVRALAAVLLSLAVMAPAVAEIGCAADTAVHVAEADANVVDADDHGDPASGSGQSDHCAFSHGHCGATTPATAAAFDSWVSDAGFDRAAGRDFSTRRPPGPERPPRG